MKYLKVSLFLIFGLVFIMPLHSAEKELENTLERIRNKYLSQRNQTSVKKITKEEIEQVEKGLKEIEEHFRVKLSSSLWLYQRTISNISFVFSTPTAEGGKNSPLADLISEGTGMRVKEKKIPGILFCQESNDYFFEEFGTGKIIWFAQLAKLERQEHEFNSLSDFYRIMYLGDSFTNL